MTSTEVIVCGGGPVGLTAAALLGRLGIRTLGVADEVRRHALPQLRSVIMAFTGSIDVVTGARS